MKKEAGGGVWFQFSHPEIEYYQLAVDSSGMVVHVRQVLGVFPGKSSVTS